MRYEMPDTVEVAKLPPVDVGDGQITRPLRVRVSSEPAPAPTSNVESVEVDRKEETVAVRSRTDSSVVEQVFRLPRFGERLVLQSDSTLFQGRVQGEPEDQAVEVYDDSSSWPKWVVGIIAILGLLVVLRVLR